MPKKIAGALEYALIGLGPHDLTIRAGLFNCAVKIEPYASQASAALNLFLAFCVFNSFFFLYSQRPKRQKH